jgi:hypothetical protein
MFRSFIPIVLFSFMAIAQAVALVKDDNSDGITVNITRPIGASLWLAGSTQSVEWCAVPLRAPLVTIPSGLLQLAVLLI